MSKLSGCIAFGLVMPFFAGCASHVRLQDDWGNAVARAEAMSEERTASIVSSTGDTIQGRPLSFARDSLRWTPRRGGPVATLPLGEVESITMTQSRWKVGATVGAIAGAAVSMVQYEGPLLDSGGPWDGYGNSYRVFLTSALGAGLGALLGLLLPESIHFVP
jgi:hypothetical protein